MPVNLGCTWNDTLVQQVFNQTAWQASALGINVGLSPVVNMFPDPRFGRLQEGETPYNVHAEPRIFDHVGFSEDPYLTSRMGVSAVVGLQGGESNPLAPLSEGKLSAVVKHFVLHCSGTDH